MDATVTRLDVSAYRVPLPSAESDGTLTWEAVTVVVVMAEGAGTAGLGWTYAPAATAGLVTELLRPVVIDGPVLDVPAQYRSMSRAVRNAGPSGLARYAVSATDVALWDLKAKILAQPLHRLLGRVRDELPVYASGGFTNLGGRQLRSQVTGWLDRGFPRLKIKIGESWGTRSERDLSRTRKVREMAGDSVALYVDANGGYSRGQARRIGRRLEELGVTWFEEPVSSDDLDGLAELRTVLAVDVVAGEYGTTPAYFERMAPHVDCLQVDASRCGGISGWLEAVAVAEAHSLDVSAHCAPHLHLAAAAAAPRLRHLEWFVDHELFESRYLDGAVTPEQGIVRVSGDAPGHGLRLKTTDLADHRVAA